MARDATWIRFAAGGVAAAGAVAVWDGGIAFWAQRAGIADAARNDYPFYGYPLIRHVLAMLLLSVLTVAVATALTRQGARLLAVVVAVGVTAGPMIVIAAPVRASLVSAFTETVAWWQVAVGAPQLAILLGATWWSARAIPPITGALRLDVQHGRDHQRDAARFAVVTMAAVTAQVVTSHGIDQEPRIMVIAGWAVLAAGLAVVVHRPAYTWVPAAAFLGGAVVPVALWAAYCTQRGAWPAVAGWETFTQSPVVLAWITPVVLLTAPLLALAVGLRHRAAVVPATA